MLRTPAWARRPANPEAGWRLQALACSRAAPAWVRASSVMAAAIASLAAFTAATAEGTASMAAFTAATASRTSPTSGPEPKMASVCGRS